MRRLWKTTLGIVELLEISRSGESQRWTHFRWACPKFLRQNFHEFAALSIPQLRLGHGVLRNEEKKAIMTPSARWPSSGFRILFRCRQTRTPYDESVLLHARTQRQADGDSPTLPHYREPPVGVWLAISSRTLRVCSNFLGRRSR
jgi:hypothetical protein